MSLLSRLAVQAARAYGILSSKAGVSASYLVVAGGGAGGGDRGGGGGAGGYRTGTTTLSTLTTYTVTVGAGGVGGSGTGASGSNSVFSTITSAGGGGGGNFANGVAGGSGGGGWGASGGSPYTGGAGNTPSTSPSQGNNGGSGDAGGNRTGGGGGGAGEVGNTDGQGAGGDGTASSITGSSVTYAGGGGGGGIVAGIGSDGGGGAGAASGNGTAGTTNLGGGGGGGGDAGSPKNGGSGGSGIVIISYTSATPKFVGGTLTTSGGNQIHTFTSSGTLSPLTPVTASYLVVAGGGSGSTAIGYTEAAGGGGAGGLLSGSTTLYSGATYVVTVGGGGAGSGSYASGNNGSNSVLSGTGITTITSTGGGRGNGDSPGENGGSGGGGGAAVTSRAGGTGIVGQGNNGGSGFGSGTNSLRSGGGGGGASAVGANASSAQGGAGGAGTASSITGTSVTYAAGGGGSSQSAGGSGGSSIGGNGQGLSPATSTTSGTVNTGSGGGASTNGTSGSGGSGTVIISYAGSQVFNGGLVTSSGGNTIHTFNATGALTPVTNNLNNSLRFRSSASAYLNRTPTLTGNRQTFTYSFWTKLGGVISAGGDFISSNNAAGGGDAIALQSSSRIAIAGSGTNLLVTTQLLRDPSAWYHIVVAVDTTQATSANRIKLYINGNQVTAFNTASYPALNYNFAYWNSSSYAQLIGRGYSYFDGYMTDINFIDGQALEPYYFGSNDANGVWKPIKYTGMYGTNGFYLTFADTSALTTSSNVGLGKDTSGNGNYWATNNISITAGTTYDAMLDVPTNTSATVANYAVMNPLSSASGTLTNGNLTFSNAGAVKGAKGTFALESGKWYWENTITTLGANDLGVGILFDGATDGMRDGTATSTYSVFYQANTNVRKNGSVVANYASYTTGDIIGIAYDADARSITFYKNNTSQGSITADAPTSPYVVWIIQPNSITATVNANFGQRPFSYTPPSGFVALNTYNLPTPTILQGSNNFGVLTYTGNGSTSATRIDTNAVNFTPDFVWIKSRSSTNYHNLYDVNRIVSGDYKRLYSNDTLAEESSTYSGATNLNSFVSGGFTTGAGGDTNTNAATYVAWCWDANGAPSSNTSGSITSTVSVNTTAGFSVVTWSGNSTVGATIGHGLGVAPKLVIMKRRNGATNWPVWVTGFNSTTFLFLQSTNAVSTAENYFNSTLPSSTLITLSANSEVNTTGGTYVAYCWAEIAGFSKAFSFTGNASTDGPFVFCNFRPRFILFKNSSAATVWIIFDTARNTYNFVDTQLRPNASDADNSAGSAYSMDILSNGFKVRSADSNFNGSGNTIIGMAFAEHPFKNSNSR